jgi:hypothetical protein
MSSSSVITKLVDANDRVSTSHTVQIEMNAPTTLGVNVGETVGLCVGLVVGDAVGARVGTCVVGARVGSAVGDWDGIEVGTDVGAALVDPQMMNPALVTLVSDVQMIGTPAVTARLLIWASVCSRVAEVPIVK